MKIQPIQRATRWPGFTCAIAICCVVSSLAAVWAVGAEPEEAPLLEIDARFVRATGKQARKAFGDSIGKGAMKSELTSEQFGKALQSLVRQKAEIFSNPHLVAMIGKRAVAETVREMRYPTQFDPSKDEPGKLIPVAFETRKIGVTLEVEALTKDGQIQVSVVPKVVSFLGFIDMGRHNAGPAAPGPHPMAESLKRGVKEGDMWQPVFDTQQITANLSVKSGDTVMVGELPNNPISKEIGTDNLRTFVFITARTLPARNAAAESHPATP